MVGFDQCQTGIFPTLPLAVTHPTSTGQPDTRLDPGGNVRIAVPSAIAHHHLNLEPVRGAHRRRS